MFQTNFSYMIDKYTHSQTIKLLWNYFPSALNIDVYNMEYRTIDM